MSEAVGIIEQAAKLSPEERLRDYLDADIGHWITTDFKEELTKILSVPTHERNNISWPARIASHMNRLTKGLYYMSEGQNPDSEVIKGWTDKLEDDFYGKDRYSIVSYCGANGVPPSETFAVLEGSKTLLTTLRLIEAARPNLKGKITIESVLTSGYEDARDKIDLVLRLGDKNDYAIGNPEIIRLIQLKTSKSAGIEAYRLPYDPNELTGETDHLLNRNHARTFIRAARKMEGSIYPADRYDVQNYVVAIPSVHSDVFGNIQLKYRRQTIQDFDKIAYQAGLLPSKKIGGGQ